MCAIDGSFASKVPNSRLDDTIDIAAPYVARHHRGSAVLKHERGPRELCTRRKEVYGSAKGRIAFDIGNGGAGFTGILRVLAEAYIQSRGGGLRIGWIPNHSRHSQAALLADIVQVALTYEPHYEALTVQEGWARKVLVAFNDHFVLVGPAAAADRIAVDGGIVETLAAIAALPQTGEGAVFHSRGDGSATFAKESELFRLAGVDVAKQPRWIHTKPGTPFDALQLASERGLFLLSDRATFLSFKQERPKTELRCFVEGGPLLLNPCSAMVNLRAPNAEATRFAEWLGGEQVRRIVAEYGRDWDGVGTPLFSVPEMEDVGVMDRLPGHY